MNNTPETIADICREMRNLKNAEAFDNDYNFVSITEIADRIEAAAKRTIYTDNSETLVNALNRINELTEEVDRLRAALKPVLEINLAGLANYGIDCKSLLAAIVADARNIYKEGANND